MKADTKKARRFDLDAMTDVELLDAVSKADALAWEAFYDRFRNLMIACITRVCLRSGVRVQPDDLMDILCDAEPVARAGRQLAYHAVTGGFVLGEVVRRVTGRSIREVLDGTIRRPLGFRWLSYGVAPDDVGYVETHGTGTPLGDPIELRALATAYGAGRRAPQRIGAAKAAMGHLEACAGALGLLAAVHVVRTGEVPPVAGYPCAHGALEGSE
jgi:hypothetical protein